MWAGIGLGKVETYNNIPKQLFMKKYDAVYAATILAMPAYEYYYHMKGRDPLSIVIVISLYFIVMVVFWTIFFLVKKQLLSIALLYVGVYLFLYHDYYDTYMKTELFISKCLSYILFICLHLLLQWWRQAKVNKLK